MLVNKLLLSSNANNGTNASLANFSSNNGVGNANANIGFHSLCDLNFYLWLLEEVKVKHYFRYADDIVILSNNKEFLRKVLIVIKLYLKKFFF